VRILQIPQNFFERSFYQESKQSNAAAQFTVYVATLVLDIKIAIEKKKNDKSLKKLMIEALKNTEVLDEVSMALLDTNK